MNLRPIHPAFHRSVFLVVLGCLCSVSTGFSLAQNGSDRVASLGQSATDEKKTVESLPLSNSSSLPGPVYGEPVDFQWRTVAKAVAPDGQVDNIFITMPIPDEWPEQSVIKGEEEIPFEVTGAEIRKIRTAPKQFVAALPGLSKGSSAVFSLTFTVSVRPIAPPADTTIYVIPERLDKDLKTWLDDSPGISHKDSKVRATAKEIIEGAENDWGKVEKIRDWISSKIAPSNQENADTPITLKTESGTVENRTRLFVAMCRAVKIPARMVWAHGNDHAEFYLEVADGTGYWFPCHISSSIPLGADPKPGVVQQKGDHFRVPEKKEELNFVNGFASAKGRFRPAIGFAEGLVGQ